MTDLANPLSASSVLLAILAILYGAWYSDITKAGEIEFADQLANRKGQRQTVISTLITKSVPLAVGSVVTSLVFLLRGIAIAAQAFQCWFGQVCTYDDVQAAMVLIEVFVLVIALSASMQTIALIKKWRESYVP